MQEQKVREALAKAAQKNNDKAAQQTSFDFWDWLIGTGRG